MKYFNKAAKSNQVTQRELNHRRLAYEAALEGIVLLENKDNTLPIEPGPIALYGTGSIYTIKGGTGSGEVNERYNVSIIEGLESAGFTITSTEWLSDCRKEYEQKLAEFKLEITRKSRALSINGLMNAMGEQFLPPFGREISESDCKDSNTDTAVYVISRQAGEGLDRRIDKGENDPSSQEIEHIRSLIKHYRKTILIINTGSSLNMSCLDDLPGLGALIYLCQQGMEGGNALAAILTGKTSPSGRLTSTWAATYEDIPFAMDYSYLNDVLDKEDYREGIYVGYRYFDSFEVKPRYEFGYGLSYTTTDIELIAARNFGSQIKLEARVTNTGSRVSKESVQVYISCPAIKLHREYQQLAAFAKTDDIEPGSSELVTLQFDLCDVAAYDESEASYILEKGDYIVRLGHSSRRTHLAAVINLDNNAVVSRHEHICPMSESIEELEPPKTNSNSKQELELLNLPKMIKLALSASSIIAVDHTYKKPEIYHDDKVDYIMAKLSVQDMVDVVVGSGMFFGKNRVDIPGSVGNTTSKLYKKDLINVALCDGPAGLRLSLEAGLKKSGRTKPYAMPLSFFETFPKLIKKLMTADRNKTIPIYQYATAFPVGSALGQSWNTKLMEQVGLAVGAEMEEYGVTYWLAPALNIQRNPLCGRNFEYYSEDPLLSGKVAAAIVRGVQSYEGAYATIKHFLCNNQEDNRNHVSSNVSERPLREIYLRGFQIAVEEGKTKSVMTSYNRINGVYAPESYDACTKLLRNEWGFSGVVMTDWMSTSKTRASAAAAIAAGNDLIMAGMAFDRRDIKRALKKRTLSEDDLKLCCANVVRSIVHSNVAREVSAEMFEL